MSAGPELPVVYLTKDRTTCAVAAADALLSNLSATGYTFRHIVCDDRSAPGHLEAVLSVYRSHGVSPVTLVNSPDAVGLGASMNAGLRYAFSDPGVSLCMRIEDDWVLNRPLDLGPWLDSMGPLHIGSLRLGMMFRDRAEFRPFPLQTGGECELWRVNSMKRQLFTFNNQVAVVSRDIFKMVGRYPVNAKPSDVEKHAAHIYNRTTDYGSKPPFVAWPSRWDTKTHYGDNLPFVHVGRSISGHNKLYPIPASYMAFNDPGKDRALREAALTGTTMLPPTPPPRSQPSQGAHSWPSQESPLATRPGRPSPT